MARGPDGSAAASAPCEALTPEEAGFLQGLEGVIDRALQGARPGERFVYGIHDQLAPRIAECVVRRYLSAGWSEARILPGATGSAMLLLAP
jgi:hypothetical protein